MSINNPYQNYLSISEAEEFHQEVGSILGTAPHGEQSFADDTLHAIKNNSPYVVILDGSAHQKTLSLIKTVRNRHPLANIPIIVITAPQNSFGAKLSLYQNISALSREDMPFELKTYVEIAVDEQFTDRNPDQTHSYTIEFFADIWREGRSAIILLSNSRSLTIHRGGVLSLSHISFIQKALYLPPPQYKQIESTKNGDWISVGSLLWSEAKKYCHSGFLKHRKWLLFVPSQYSFRALELPISLPTRKLLFSTNAGLPLVQRIRELKLNIPQIEQDIEILYLLGLYSFQKTKSQEHFSLKAQDTTKSSSLLPREDWNTWLEESLLEQWRRRHLFNPWASLDFNPKENLSEQLEKRKENLKIYQTLSSANSQRKRQQIIDHIEHSSQLLALSKHLYEIYGYPEYPEQEELFFQALSYLKEKKLEDALQILNNLPEENTIYQAFLGWGIFLRDDEQLKRGFELVSKALHGQQASIFFETLACAIQVYLKQWNMAEKKIRFLLKNYHTEQLRSLLWLCQSKQVPSKNWLLSKYLP